MAGSFVSPLAEIPGNLIQWLASSVVYLVLGRVLDRANIKQKLGEI